MVEIVAVTNLQKKPGFLYYIKNGAIFEMKKGTSGRKVMQIPNFVPDYSEYLYFVDKNGNVARTGRKKR